MKSFATAAILLVLAASAHAQDTSTALQGLQQCVQDIPNPGFINGWYSSSATTGRKMLQTAENCAQAAAISSAIPCTPQTVPSTPTSGTPPTPTTPTTPAGVAASSNPCGDSSNPVPWTGLLCSGGSVTQIIMSQLGPNFFQGKCNLSSLGGLASLSSVQTVDFTASGLSGSIPAEWATGNWSASLKSLTLAQNPEVTGPVGNFSGFSALDSINIASSGFTGSIPLSSQGYPALLSFVATGNDLTGTLPADLPANLTTLNVDDNMLNGTLPAYTSNSLSTLQVANNTLSGCLPADWTTNLPNLTTVDLSYNDLAGPIPSTWQASGAFSKLQTINIVGNELCGELGSLGTPVGTVGQNNPSATRLVPNPGTLPACSGTSCSDDGTLNTQRGAFFSLENGAYAPGPGPTPALAPQTAITGSQAPSTPTLPVLSMG